MKMGVSCIFHCHITEWADSERQTSPPPHTILCVPVTCQETLPHQLRILRKSLVHILLFPSCISMKNSQSWRKAYILLHSRLNQKSVYIVTPTGPIVRSLSTNVRLSLLSYSPSPLQEVISDLCTVPVFPLWSHKLLEDRAVS